jgi:hypothetical protein
MKEPFTIEQFTKIKSQATTAEIMDVCTRMHNWKDLVKKNVSASLTFQNWYNRDKKQSK